MNVNVASYDPRNIKPNLKFGENPLDYHCYFQQLQICDKQYAHLYHFVEFQRKFKKSEISEPMMDSTSRISNSSPYRSKQGRPTKRYSQPCLKFRRGNCNYGGMCIFTHDETRDARKSIYSRRGGIVAEDQHSMVGRDKFCKYFTSRQSCPYGDSCHFTHHILENVKGVSAVHRDNTAITVVNIKYGAECRKGINGMDSKGGDNLNSNANEMQLNKVFWKTRLCRKWETFGSCPYGIKCHYAHGEKELCKIRSFHQESGKSFGVGNVAVRKENAASTNKVIRTFKQCEKSKNCLDKWNSIAKINRIYADWIESLPPDHIISCNQ